MKKVILITGTGRSGSTLLDMMLGNDRDGFSVGEMHALFRPWRSHHPLGGKGCFCEDDGCDFWKRMKKGGEKRIYSNLFDELGVDFIVDSSKSPIWFEDRIGYFLP